MANMKNKKERFIPEQIEEIRDDYNVLDVKYLAKKYKVSVKTIHDIGKYKTYIK